VAAAPAKSQNFLAGLFTSEKSQGASNGSMLDRAASAIGLRGSAPAPVEAPVPPAKPAPEIKQAAKPAPKPTPVKPKPLPATAVAQAKPQLITPTAAPVRAANAAAIRPTASAQRATQTAEAGQPASASLLAGAAPVVPTGSFGSAWSTLR
jgi:hypothetical protein